MDDYNDEILAFFKKFLTELKKLGLKKPSKADLKADAYSEAYEEYENGHLPAVKFPVKFKKFFLTLYEDEPLSEQKEEWEKFETVKKTIKKNVAKKIPSFYLTWNDSTFVDVYIGITFEQFKERLIKAQQKMEAQCKLPDLIKNERDLTKELVSLRKEIKKFKSACRG